MPTGQVATVEEEGSMLSEHVTGENSESKVEVVGGINVCLAQAMRHLGIGTEIRQVSKGQGRASPHPGGSEFPIGGEHPRDQTSPKSMVGGGRAHCSLARTRNTGRSDRGGQEFYSPSRQWQSGEYDHVSSGAAVWVPRPPSGRPYGLSGEPHGVRRDMH